MTKVDLLEAMFRGLIESGIKPSKILYAFYRACQCEDILNQAGWFATAETLDRLFAGFDRSLFALHDMETR